MKGEGILLCNRRKLFLEPKYHSNDILNLSLLLYIILSCYPSFPAVRMVLVDMLFIDWWCPNVFCASMFRCCTIIINCITAPGTLFLATSFCFVFCCLFCFHTVCGYKHTCIPMLRTYVRTWKCKPNNTATKRTTTTKQQ